MAPPPGASAFVVITREAKEAKIRTRLVESVRDGLVSQSVADSILGVLAKRGDDDEILKREILDEYVIADMFPRWFIERACKKLNKNVDVPAPVVTERSSGDPDAMREDRDKTLVECDACGKKFKAGAGIAKHQRSCQASQQQDEAANILSQKFSQDSPTALAPKKQKVQTPSAVLRDRASELWKLCAKNFKGNVALFEKFPISPTFVASVNEAFGADASIRASDLAAWFGKQKEKERKKKFEDACEYMDEDEYEPIEYVNDDVLLVKTRAVHDTFQKQCGDLFLKSRMSDKTDAVVPPSGTGVTWMVDSGPTPTDEMLQYEWPRGWHTTGYIFYPKGGRAKLNGYQWIYLSESMHEIEARAKETIESEPDNETLTILKPIMEDYEQFGFRCKKRGFKHGGLCYNRPCERCWRTLYRWSRTTKTTDDDDFYEQVDKIGLEQYESESWDEAKFREEHKNRYDDTFWSQYDRIRENRTFVIGECVMARLELVTGTSDETISYVYWPVDVCGYARGKDSYNIIFTYGTPYVSNRRNWLIKTESEVFYDIEDDDSIRKVTRLVPRDDKRIADTKSRLGKIGPAYKKHFEDVVMKNM